MSECCELRFKDIDFDQGLVFVRRAKGDKDRSTLLAELGRDELRAQLRKSEAVHQADRRSRLAGVWLPDALTDKNVQGAPGLVIEILSPSTRQRDLTLKRQLFDREGVRECWVVDPERNSVAVYRRDSDGSFPLAATLEAGNGETLTTPLLPGWQLSLERRFRL